MLAPPGLRELIQGLVIVMKMLRVKPEGVSRWVAAGLCWVWVICSTQEAEAAGVLFRAGMSLLGQVLAVAGTFPVAFGPEEIPSVPCFLCLFSNNSLHVCLFLAKFWHHFSVTVLRSCFHLPGEQLC